MLKLFVFVYEKYLFAIMNLNRFFSFHVFILSFFNLWIQHSPAQQTLVTDMYTVILQKVVKAMLMSWVKYEGN